MKRPNGYGAVINLGKGRRRPWAARVTDDEKSATPNPDGSYTQKFRYIGYFEKKSEAYDALADFNTSVTPARYATITFSEVWELWAQRNLGEKSKSRADAYKAAYKKCAKLYRRPMADLRLYDIQSVVDAHEGASLSALNQLKIVISLCFEWAIKNDVIEKDYSKFLEIRPRESVSHKPLTHAQVDMLKSKRSMDLFEKMAMIQLYTGVRPGELLELPVENINLEQKFFEITKSKTKNGLRIVPIADAILPIFRYFVERAKGGTLFPISSDEYSERFKNYFVGHTPHDARTTFISFMQEIGTPIIILQKIVGHASGNITGDVYTQLSLQPLLDAVNKL